MTFLRSGEDGKPYIAVIATAVASTPYAYRRHPAHNSARWAAIRRVPLSTCAEL
jgi:hypothetical protein